MFSTSDAAPAGLPGCSHAWWGTGPSACPRARSRTLFIPSIRTIRLHSIGDSVTGRPASAEAEVRSGNDHLGTDRPQHRLDELLREEPRQLEVELDHERLLDACLRDQLEPALTCSALEACVIVPARAAFPARSL